MVSTGTTTKNEENNTKNDNKEKQNDMINDHENGNETSSQLLRHRLVTRFTKRSTIHNVQDDEPIEAASVDKASIVCGLIAGILQAGLFSPYDRALYLSMTNGTPFLSKENFRNPMIGLSQSIGGRALSGGLFFPLEQYFFRLFRPPPINNNNYYCQQNNTHPHNKSNENNNNNNNNNTNSKMRNFLAGTAAGAMNAIILNPLSAIRYKTWSRVYHNRGMIQEAINMFEKGGKKVVFTRGLTSTLLRDITFGGCYTFMRLQAPWTWSLPPEHQWMANLVSAALATIISGPFNLARNVQYSTSSAEIAPTTKQVIQVLIRDTQQIQGGVQQKWLFLSRRLRLGWGTARVAMGMAFAHRVYDGLHALAHSDDIVMSVDDIVA